MKRKILVWWVAAMSTVLSVAWADGPTDQRRDLLRQVMRGGPYGKPWRIEGLRPVHFPVTTSHPDVQGWLDQGITQLHAFEYYEAKRTFRWAIKLDPECAMAYWGLAQVRGVPEDLQKALIREAVKHKAAVSARERGYIKAWEARLGLDPTVAPDSGAQRRAWQRRLDKLLFEHPNDIEATTLYAWRAAGGGHGAETMLQQVLRSDPNHPGAHHYRIHMWDGRQSAHVVDSARALSRTVTASGHLMHMPGHIMSALGLWPDAEIAMEAADRAELKYMRDKQRMPFDSWNYGHNRNYLCYLREQRGMARAAIAGARELLRQPLDPESKHARRWRPRLVGKTALLRALATFERWELLLEPGMIPWTDDIVDRVARDYVESLAHWGLGDLASARERQERLSGLKETVEKDGDARLKREYAVHVAELDALLTIAKGDILGGLNQLAKAAEMEADLRRRWNDPPMYPRFLYAVLGDQYLEHRNPGLAVEAFRRGLELVPNDGLCLSGLVRAYAELDDTTEAQAAYSRLLWVYSQADGDLAGLRSASKAAERLGLNREAAPDPRLGGLSYSAHDLDRFGPSQWAPFTSPPLPKPGDAEGDVSSGRNTLVVFVPGPDCTACSKQLASISDRLSELEAEQTDVIVVAQQWQGKEPPAPLDSAVVRDPDWSIHRQFSAWDDFEDAPLKMTALIDRAGKLRWVRYGHDAFLDIDFLLTELRHLNGRHSI